MAYGTQECWFMALNTILEVAYNKFRREQLLMVLHSEWLILASLMFPRMCLKCICRRLAPGTLQKHTVCLTHNCNNFSNEVAQFLVGATIPDYILNLPNEVMSGPMGPLIMPMIQQLESTLRAGAVPQAPQFRPSAATTPKAAASSGQVMKSDEKSATASKAGQQKSTDEKVVPTAVVPAAETQEKSSAASSGVAGDPLGNARNKVQEEIGREFAAIMASGTFRASEAAALATRRVMEKYGHVDVAQS